MSAEAQSLLTVYRGWDGYQTSLVHAVAPLSPEQLAFRPAPQMRSVGEIVRHLSGGRIDWFLRMQSPGGAEIAAQVPEWEVDEHGNRYVVKEALTGDAAGLVHWLEITWRMIEQTLTEWTVADLE